MKIVEQVGDDAPKQRRVVCDVRLTLDDEVFDLVGLSESDARRMADCCVYDTYAEIVATRTVEA